jgi:hypothetical protein
MALPLLFFIGSSIVRAATPTIARLLVKQGYKRASSTVVKNTLKTAKKIRTIGKKKDIPIAKSKSLTVPKNQSTALTKINKVTGGGKSSNVGGKVIAGGATVISGAAALSTDKKKGDAKAESSKKKGKVDVGLQEALKKKKKKKKVETPKGVSQGSTAGTATTMTFGKAFRAAKDAGKKEFTYRGKRYNTRTKDEEKKSAKKVEKKTPNYAGSQSIPKKAEKKKEEPKKSKSFLDRVKEDFSKAVKETKRNFSGDFKKGTGRYKSISTGKTNFNKKKKKAS